MPRLDELLAQIDQQKVPPVEQWHPEHCADMDLVIRRDGQWIHEGSAITRMSMVKLFASILKREGDCYFLVTPVEKVGIQVESTPFVVVASERIDERWFITNNLGEVIELNSACSLDSHDDQCPTLMWRRNLPARIQQNVFYQWQMYALDHGGLEATGLWLRSGDERLLLERV